MAGRKKKSQSALGDDPLSWLGDEKVAIEKDEHKNVDTAQQSDSTSPGINISGATAMEDDNQDSVTIMLNPVITLAEVSQLKESLIGYLGAHQVQVDVSKVEHIDTAGLQLLIAFSKALKKQGGKIIWRGWSAAYSSTADMLNLNAVLGSGKK
jgi:anti-anti-sigma regulatory factor